VRLLQPEYAGALAAGFGKNRVGLRIRSGSIISCAIDVERIFARIRVVEAQ